MEISATFFVGLSGGSWQHAGPYVGRGPEIGDAAAEALGRCARDFADQLVVFTTFASINSVPSVPFANHHFEVPAE